MPPRLLSLPPPTPDPCRLLLQLDAANVEALVGLGVMEMNAGAVEAGAGRLRSAYQVYPYSAQCLNAVNNHLFRAGQHGLLAPLQEAALACTDHPLMHAESLYFLGRSCHANWEYSKAASYYRAAMKEAGAPHHFLLPFYAMAQLHVQRGNGAEALALLQQVLALHPANAEALKAAAAIHAQQGRTKEALACLRKATEAAPSDLQAWTHSADLLAHTNQEEALKALTAVGTPCLQRCRDAEMRIADGMDGMGVRQARKIVEARGDRLPLPLLNNLGVLHMERGEVAAAREVLSEGLGEVGEAIPVTKLSLLYNRARLYEAEHHTQQAVAIYERIRSQVGPTASPLPHPIPPIPLIPLLPPASTPSTQTPPSAWPTWLRPEGSGAHPWPSWRGWAWGWTRSC